MTKNWEIKNIIGTGLNETPKDLRDFKAEKTFGSIGINSVPKIDFKVAEPLEIKEQYNSDFCTAFATTAVSEDQECVKLAPEWFFAQEKKLTGDYKSWGCDLRVACKTAVNTGFLEEQDQKYNLLNEDRNFLANWENWNIDTLDKAYIHRKKSYFSIDGLGKDMFESMRIALWQHLDNKCSILTGVIWQKEWTYSENGIIQKEEGTKLEGHAIKIFGQKIIDGEIYLMAQLSNGIEIGDKGIFYFPKEVINSCFTFGAYCFIDIDPNEVKKNNWDWKQKLLDFIIKRLYK